MGGLTESGWLWLYAGAGLMLFEIVLPGFVAFFFGIAAATTGFIGLAAGDAFSPAWQMASFSAFSILYLAFLRRFLKNIFSGDSEDGAESLTDGFAGRRATVTQAITPPGQGRVMLGDAEWSAVADAPIPAGAQVEIISRNNLTLKVEECK